MVNGRVAVCGTRIVAGDVRGAVMKWQIGEGEEVIMICEFEKYLCICICVFV